MRHNPRTMYRNSTSSGDKPESRRRMNWLLWSALGFYLFVGAGQASRNISRGMVGKSGPVATFFFVTLFWPFAPRA